MGLLSFDLDRRRRRHHWDSSGGDSWGNRRVGDSKHGWHSWDNRCDGESDNLCYGESKHGVEVKVILGDVVVVTLYKNSTFYQHSAWMLQAALGSGQKTDALYQYTEDSVITEKMRQLGHRPGDFMVAEVKSEDLRHIQVVGMTGKRSMMLALVLALALQEEDHQDLKEGLKSYNIRMAFEELLDYVKDTIRRQSTRRSTRASSRDDTWANSGWQEGSSRRRTSGEKQQWETKVEPPAAIGSDEVDVQLVRRDVPVISMEKSSPFHTVQMLIDAFTVQVDEFNARTARDSAVCV